MSIIKKGLIRLTVILFLLSNVSCSAQEIGKTLIEIEEIGAAYAVLIWKAVPNVTGYEVYSSIDETKTYTLLSSTSDLTYRDDTLVPLTTATYKVRQRDCTYQSVGKPRTFDLGCLYHRGLVGVGRDSRIDRVSDFRFEGRRYGIDLGVQYRSAFLFGSDR